MTKFSKKVAVIGAGVSGLCTARYASAAGHEVTVYEQTSEIGGTWVYTDRTGTDEYGLQIHTSMYKNLRANSPKETMEFWHFPTSNNLKQSYLPSEDIIQYLTDFVACFDLRRLIKFSHYVIRVRPVENSQWEVIVKDLPNNRIETQFYDAIFVCNGHYSVPNLPQIPGIEKFKGTQEHSHDYRTVDKYKDKDVLIVGGFVSGVELMMDITKVAKSIVLSHRELFIPLTPPTNVELKASVVKEFTETGAIFADGTAQNFSNILYCTGYKYTLPFLSVDCGIHLDQNFVYPVYRHCINIMHPSMYFIGLPHRLATFLLSDIQARYCVKFLNEEKKLPSKDDMLNDTEIFIAQRKADNVPKKFWFTLKTHEQRAYHQVLANEADIEDFANVVYKINDDSIAKIKENPFVFRKYNYKIIDNSTYERTEVKEDE